MSISQSLQKAIFARLQADNNIMAIATEICLIAENPVHPFITIGAMFETPTDLMSLEKSNWRVQIDVWGDDLANNDKIHQLNDLIKKSFHRNPNNFTLDEGGLFAVEMVSKQILPDPKGWHGVIEFIFKIQTGE